MLNLLTLLSTFLGEKLFLYGCEMCKTIHKLCGDDDIGLMESSYVIYFMDRK